MAKKNWIVAALALSVCIAGCGLSQASQSNGIVIDKSGKVTEYIVEEFSQDYYSADELKAMVEEEITDFHGDGTVSLEKLEAKDNNLYMTLKYSSAKAYTAFNDVGDAGSILFVGTVSDAYASGYNMDVTMKSARDDASVITKDSILAQGEKNMVVYSGDVEVQVPGKILYISEWASADEKYAYPGDNAEGKMMYIIY